MVAPVGREAGDREAATEAAPGHRERTSSWSGLRRVRGAGEGGEGRKNAGRAGGADGDARPLTSTRRFTLAVRTSRTTVAPGGIDRPTPECWGGAAVKLARPLCCIGDFAAFSAGGGREGTLVVEAGAPDRIPAGEGLTTQKKPPQRRRTQRKSIERRSRGEKRMSWPAPAAPGSGYGPRHLGEQCSATSFLLCALCVCGESFRAASTRRRTGLETDDRRCSGSGDVEPSQLA